MTHSHDRSRRRSSSSWLGGALLNVLAALGVVCIVLVILSFVFNVSIMMFKTGSMSPTITAGSIAFVHEIPAEEMEVGDIVTADRGEKVLPVTHRVTSILETESTSGTVTFEMKGDANEAKDPEPYTADTVRKVMFSIPGIAPAIQKLRNPYALGGITIAASLLVVWAFWPRREDEDDAADRVDVVEAPARSATHSEPQSAVTRSPKHAVALPAVAAIVAAGTGMFGPLPQELAAIPAAEPAAAASGAETTTPAEVHGQYLRMRATGDESTMLSLSPGASADWTVDVWADAPDPGKVELEIGSGQLSEALASQLLVDVRTCSQIVPMDECPGGAAEPVNDVALTDLGASPDNDRRLLEMPSDEKRRVQVTVTMNKNADAEAVAGHRSGVRLTAIGQGEEVSLGPGDPGEPGPPGKPDPGDSDNPVNPGDLPRTGIEGWLWILLAAGVLIATGSAVVHRTRSRRRL